ncbi:MAG: hypothetical protein DME22_07660 [Verrucomicrobia bacterium]|nr:MAG: hypothetical protein DME22_07660 [Verrucomicrobiota bacterium]
MTNTERSTKSRKMAFAVEVFGLRASGFLRISSFDIRISACAFQFTLPPASGFVKPSAMDFPNDAKSDIHSDAFLRQLMRRQLRLSIVCALTFLIALLGLPLANYFFPEAMATRVFGFTLTWFILGVLFFPFVWIISWVFIKRSIALEEEEAAAASEATEESGKVGG